MKSDSKILLALFMLLVMAGCTNSSKSTSEGDSETQKTMSRKDLTAAEILGNPAYPGISFGGYRHSDHGIEPTLDELKDDMRILHAAGTRVVRTYKVHLPHASNVLKAISELKAEDESFEMYVMLGAWIDCKNAWTELEPDHNVESEANKSQIDEAVRLANQYPDIVKILAVGNESMVKWAAAYYVQPGVILKWVNYLQGLKQSGDLPKDLWITSSDNFASWGGGGPEYHVEDLTKLYHAVDYVSMHTYPFLDSHYNPEFWGNLPGEAELSDTEKIEAAMVRAREFAVHEYESVRAYMKSLGIDKPIHIGETGWSTVSDDFFGAGGTRAADEYKEALYYRLMREWSKEAGISLFYFEAFDEPWKDQNSPDGSENHFGLFTVEGKAKFALWDMVDEGVFEGLTRNGNPIVKTFSGDREALMQTVSMPPVKNE
jgi:exo-beta-1,3-glucanase (GH17 family)